MSRLSRTPGPLAPDRPRRGLREERHRVIQLPAPEEFKQCADDLGAVHQLATSAALARIQCCRRASTWPGE